MPDGQIHTPEIHPPLPENQTESPELTTPGRIGIEQEPPGLAEPIAPTVSSPAVSTDLGHHLTPMQQQVENILEDGMSNAYQMMDVPTQHKFRTVGESTAVAIVNLLTQTTIQARKIVLLILRWLKIIPHINPYYLEEEAQIKAAKIIKLKHPPREI